MASSDDVLKRCGIATKPLWDLIPPPVCAKCDKPVDEIATTRSIRGSFIVSVRCHGQTEDVEITDRDLELMGTNIRFGKAFTGAPMLPMKGGLKR